MGIRVIRTINAIVYTAILAYASWYAFIASSEGSFARGRLRGIIIAIVGLYLFLCVGLAYNEYGKKRSKKDALAGFIALPLATLSFKWWKP